MRRNRRFNLGNFLYLEWCKPIFDYYSTLKFKYFTFEILFPVIIGILCTVIYEKIEKVGIALNALSDLMPTAISILIGFTTMLITLLLTSSGENIDRLKRLNTNQELNGEPLSLYQSLHIQFSHSLFSEIIFLILILFYLFLKGFSLPSCVLNILLAVFIYYTLNILLSILRGIANIYFSFYNNGN